MTPLRQQMIDAMQLRGFAARTQESYIGAVRQIAKFYHRSPELITPEEVDAWFRELVLKRHLSYASCHLYLNGLRFFYQEVLGRAEFVRDPIFPKRKSRIPELLTREEVRALLVATHNRKHRMLLVLAYGCGLRVGELVAVRVHDIDSERHLLRVRQGKGSKDRLVPIAPRLLQSLTRYIEQTQPEEWLFPSDHKPGEHLHESTAQKVFNRAREESGLTKRCGIHGLRHAYATHQLEQGEAVHKLQHYLGHADLQTTMRYVHWSLPKQGEAVDLLARLGVDDE